MIAHMRVIGAHGMCTAPPTTRRMRPAPNDNEIMNHLADKLLGAFADGLAADGCDLHLDCHVRQDARTTYPDDDPFEARKRAAGDMQLRGAVSNRTD